MKINFSLFVFFCIVMCPRYSGRVGDPSMAREFPNVCISKAESLFVLICFAPFSLKPSLLGKEFFILALTYCQGVFLKGQSSKMTLYFNVGRSR